MSISRWLTLLLLLSVTAIAAGCTVPPNGARVGAVPKPEITPPPPIVYRQLPQELRVVQRPVVDHSEAPSPRPQPTPVQNRVQPLAADWAVTDGHRWTHIILHHSAADRGNAAMIDRDHRVNNGWDELGYHFVITNGNGGVDGKVTVGPRWPVQKHGAHVRVSKTDDNYWNRYGIGICLVGDFNLARPTRQQLENAARLVAYLQQQYNIPDEKVIGHNQVQGAKTDCPGRLFPYQTLMSRVHEIRRPNMARR